MSCLGKKCMHRMYIICLYPFLGLYTVLLYKRSLVGQGKILSFLVISNVLFPNGVHKKLKILILIYIFVTLYFLPHLIIVFLIPEILIRSVKCQYKLRNASFFFYIIYLIASFLVFFIPFWKVCFSHISKSIYKI